MTTTRHPMGENLHDRYGAEVSGSFEVHSYGDDVSGSGEVETERLPHVDSTHKVSVSTGEERFYLSTRRNSWTPAGTGLTIQCRTRRWSSPVSILLAFR